jgi:hypothetical protein
MAQPWRALFRWSVVLATMCVVPHLWSARHADAWFDGDAETEERLARGVDHWTEARTSPRIVSGHSVIDGEWAFATYQMAALGDAQMALEHPETRARNIERIHTCLKKLLTPHLRAFDTKLWGEDALASLDGDHGHAGYLGYLNLSLSYARVIEPDGPYAALNDRITAALVRRLERARTLMVETYPGEVYPPDNTAVVGSIGLYDRATGADHSALLRRWTNRVRRDYRDPKTGLLYQHLRTDGRPDAPGRGSGTTLGVYFLSFLNDPISEELWAAATRELDDPLAGFGAEREYRTGMAGRGDVDSGPLILSRSPVATGFALAGARLHRDRERFRHLFATSELFGAPTEVGERQNYVYGGPVGDAILFAMLTALPPSRIHQ